MTGQNDIVNCNVRNCDGEYVIGILVEFEKQKYSIYV